MSSVQQKPSIVIVWGSSTGYTEEAARSLHELLRHRVDACVDIADTSIDELRAFDVLIVGAPTWHVGELQDDWDACYDDLKELDLAGKVVALFGCGDAYGYPFSFQDALGILWQRFEAQGAVLIGRWPTAGYEFDESRALTPDGEHFVGLALDEHDQSQKTQQRIESWARQLEEELAALAEPRLAAVAPC